MPLVKLLTHPGCPGGRRAKLYFQRHHIPFEEIHLSEVNADFQKKIRTDVIVSPMILVGNTVLRGFDPEPFQQVYNRWVRMDE
ncbi:glutaredoxin [Melghirimyces profundicolus]|uniref:Glutaredoxin n=1 Tax=Melghirimyces profundicolus TaxID=1242148 RepID=A0A2T6C8S0_9BACL|nr:hypothetical protein [Melghirimyces profundicolus]PTX64718.1 glutaredoxin [Melghirimyces profundicolus]